MVDESQALEATETESEDVSLDEGESVFDDAFDEAIGDKPDEGSSEEKSEEDEGDKDKSEAEGEAESDEAEAEDESEEDKDESEEDEEKGQEDEDDKDKDEGDEDLTPAQKRGKILIESEKGGVGDEEGDEDLEDEGYSPDEGQPPPIEAIDDRVAGAYIGMLDVGKLPESLKVGDEVINLKAYYEDNPEVPVITTLMARQIIGRLVDSGVLMTGDDAAEMMEEVSDRVYRLRLTQEWPDTNMEEVIDSKEFIDWVQNEAPEETQALFRSDDPEDHVLGFREYFDNSPAKKGSKEKASKADAQARKSKAEFDAVHTSSARRTSKKGGGTPAVEEDYASAFSDAADAVEKEGV